MKLASLIVVAWCGSHAIAYQVDGRTWSTTSPHRYSTSPPRVTPLPSIKALHLRGGSTSVLETAANIFTDIVPAGMLPIASGLAIASNSLPTKAARTVAVGIIVFFSVVAHRTLVLIAEAIEASGVEPSLSGVWESSPVLGGVKTVWLVDASIALLTFGCCLYYMCFIGDLLSAAAAGMLPSSSRSSSGVCIDQTTQMPWTRRRSTHIVAASVGVLLPLCLLRDLSLLAPFSFVGVAACAYCTAFIDKRAMDGSYADGGRYDRYLRDEGHATGLRQRPHGPWALRKELPLINIISVAFLAHYNGHAYYAALRDRSVARFSNAASIALAGAVAVYTCAGLAGHACFGEASDCMALNNYARADPAAAAARLAMGVSLLASFPLMFSGLRSSLLALARAAGLGSDATLASTAVHRGIVSIGLTAIAACAVATPDISLIVSLLGAALGSILIYSLPPTLHLLAGATPLASLAGVADVVLVLFGLVLAVLGTYTALSSHASTALDTGSPLPVWARRAIQRLANPGPLHQLSGRLVKRWRATEVVFPASLSREARGQVHAIAHEHRLVHQTKGGEDARFIVVSAPRTARA